MRTPRTDEARARMGRCSVHELRLESAAHLGAENNFIVLYRLPLEAFKLRRPCYHKLSYDMVKARARAFRATERRTPDCLPDEREAGPVPCIVILTHSLMDSQLTRAQRKPPSGEPRASEPKYVGSTPPAPARPA